jgi:hypothetical protein
MLAQHSNPSSGQAQLNFMGKQRLQAFLSSVFFKAVSTRYSEVKLLKYYTAAVLWN